MNLNFEVVQSRNEQDEWRAEAIDSEGMVFVTIFSGPNAKERAEEYATWKNGVPELAHSARR
jgi:hypothetical protein